MTVDAPVGSPEVTDGLQQQSLTVSGDELEELLIAAEEDSEELWGTGVDRVESASRLMSIHLMESLETQDIDTPAQWVYTEGRFRR